MRKRGFLLLASMALALLLVSGVAWAELVKAANWQMNETPENFGQMLDSSVNNNNGTPTAVTPTGSTYGFDGSTSRVLVPDADSLDPQANDITLTAYVRVGDGTTTHQMDDDSYDVVRKGFVTTEGGDYKMEIKRIKADPTVGKLHCFFRGDLATVNKVANRDIVDGNWHTLECAKTGEKVVAKVDGRAYAKTGSAGSIANGMNVMVGAKTVDPRPDDTFYGSMDYVSIDIAQPDTAQ
jgi:hypothetical protein